MAITSIFTGNKQSNVAANSNNTRDAVQPDSLKDYLILTNDDANSAKQNNDQQPNDTVQAVKESVHSMQNQAMEGAENVKSTMEDANQQIRQQFKDQSNANNIDKDHESDTALFQAIQDKSRALKDTLMGAATTSNGQNDGKNNNTNNDGTPIKDQVKDKVDDVRETANDATSAVRYSTLHFAHDATGTTGLHSGKEKDTTREAGDHTEQQNPVTSSVLDAASEAKDRVYNYLVDAKDTLVSPQDHTMSKRNEEQSDKQTQGTGLGDSIADTASQFKEKVMSISQDTKSSDAGKQSNNQDQNEFLETLKNKADEGGSILVNQLDGLKNTVQGNTTDAKEYSASAKTQLAEQEMEEAHNLMGKVAIDKRDVIQMRTDQSNNLLERAASSEKNGNDGMLEGANQKLEEGKNLVADYMTDKTIQAKEGLANRKQDLAGELYQDAKTMTAEAMQDALKAAELRTNEKTNTSDKQKS